MPKTFRKNLKIMNDEDLTIIEEAYKNISVLFLKYGKKNVVFKFLTEIWEEIEERKG